MEFGLIHKRLETTWTCIISRCYLSGADSAAQNLINKSVVLSAADFGHQRPEDHLRVSQWAGSMLQSVPQTQLQGDTAGNHTAL